MPLTTFKGNSIGYDIRGQGPPLLLLHGIFVSRAQWEETARELSSSFRVVTCDLRGHGESSSVERGVTVAELADDVAALLDHLELEQVVCCGHSFGGFVAQELALRHPDRVRGLILAETIYGVCSTPIEAAITATSAAALRFVDPRFLLSAFSTFFGALSSHGIGQISQEASRHLREEGAALAILDASMRFDSRWRLEGLRCPTLILVGQIPQIPLVSLQALELWWRIGDARLAVIPLAGHMMHWDNPAAFREALREFTASLSSDRPAPLTGQAA